MLIADYGKHQLLPEDQFQDFQRPDPFIPDSMYQVGKGTSWFRYMFHDIGLALIDPKTGAVEKTSSVDDVKYNSSPDITWHNESLAYVYNKFEHLYGGRNDPGRLYGCFIGRLRPSKD